MKDDYTHITVLMDRSGSMASIKTDMEGGINTFITEQKAVPGEATFALYEFDDHFDEAVAPTDLADVGPVTLNPRGSTALYDAMQKSIALTGEYLSSKPDDERPSKVFFVVVTDGQENASREVTRKQVLDLVTQQTDLYSWEFVYLGANQDAMAVGTSMGIHVNTTYDTSAASVGRSYTTLSSNMTKSRMSGQSIVMPTSTKDDEEAPV